VKDEEGSSCHVILCTALGFPEATVESLKNFRIVRLQAEIRNRHPWKQARSITA
jgi:hypothetical protein